MRIFGKQGTDAEPQQEDFARPLRMADYRSLVASLPSPTQQQMQQFSEHVSEAHSWYKHLPLLPPGVPFHFYLDPAAGMELVQQPDGKLKATTRLERGFHYSWLPTADYRELFGYLAFSPSAGPVVSAVDETGARTIPSDVDCLVFDPRVGFQRLVPVEVFEAGRTFVSGIVHGAGTNHGLLNYTIGANPNFVWPSESGGASAMANIVARCQLLMADPSRIERVDFNDEASTKYLRTVAGNFDIPLYEALEPERQRQRAGMIAAMVRVVKLAHAG